MHVAGGLHPSAQMVPVIRANSILCVPTPATPIAQKRWPLSHRPRVWLMPPGAVGRGVTSSGHPPPCGGPAVTQRPVGGLAATLTGSCSQEPGKHWMGGLGFGAPKSTRSVTLERDLEVPANRGVTGKGRGQGGSFLCPFSLTHSFLWQEAWRGGLGTSEASAAHWPRPGPR